MTVISYDAVRGMYARSTKMVVSYMSGSLNPRIVEPGVKLGAPFKKAVRTVGCQFDQYLRHILRRI